MFEMPGRVSWVLENYRPECMLAKHWIVSAMLSERKRFKNTNIISNNSKSCNATAKLLRLPVNIFVMLFDVRWCTCLK